MSRGPSAAAFLAAALQSHKIQAHSRCVDGAFGAKRAARDSFSPSLPETPPRAADRTPLPVVGVQRVLWM